MRLIAGAIVLVGLGWPTAVADATTTPCPPAGAKTILRNDHAVVYTNETGTLYGCVPPAGMFVPLAFAQTFYRPPVMALSKDVAAVVVADDQYGLRIRINRLVEGGLYENVYRPTERIGAVRVRGDGTMAFVACPPNRGDADRLYPPVEPGKHCTGPTASTNRVYLYRRDVGLRRVGRARHLSPRSLRLSSTAVSWTQHGRRRRVVYNTPAPARGRDLARAEASIADAQAVAAAYRAADWSWRDYN